MFFYFIFEVTLFEIYIYIYNHIESIYMLKKAVKSIVFLKLYLFQFRFFDMCKFKERRVFPFFSNIFILLNIFEKN